MLSKTWLQPKIPCDPSNKGPEFNAVNCLRVLKAGVPAQCAEAGRTKPLTGVCVKVDIRDFRSKLEGDELFTYAKGLSDLSRDARQLQNMLSAFLLAAGTVPFKIEQLWQNRMHDKHLDAFVHMVNCVANLAVFLQPCSTAPPELCLPDDATLAQVKDLFETLVAVIMECFRDVLKPIIVPCTSGLGPIMICKVASAVSVLVCRLSEVQVFTAEDFLLRWLPWIVNVFRVLTTKHGLMMETTLLQQGALVMAAVFQIFCVQAVPVAWLPTLFHSTGDFGRLLLSTVLVQSSADGKPFDLSVVSDVTQTLCCVDFDMLDMTMIHDIFAAVRVTLQELDKEKDDAVYLLTLDIHAQCLIVMCKCLRKAQFQRCFMALTTVEVMVRWRTHHRFDKTMTDVLDSIEEIFETVAKARTL